MMNPYDAPHTSSTSETSPKLLPKRPISSIAFLRIFVPVFIAGLFVPTVEFFQNKTSWGHLPLWYVYAGLSLPEYWNIAIPIVAAHIGATAIIAYAAERYLMPRLVVQNNQSVS